MINFGFFISFLWPIVGDYYYHAGGAQIKCVGGFATVMSPVRYHYKSGGEAVTCEILDADTGRSEFTIQVQSVKVIK